MSIANRTRAQQRSGFHGPYTACFLVSRIERGQDFGAQLQRNLDPLRDSRVALGPVGEFCSLLGGPFGRI
jgi:hypothetical protein